MAATKRKATGAHFTPPDLAALVAERLAGLSGELKGPIRILDPACGDGNLLQAIAHAMPEGQQRRLTLIGIEQDDEAFATLGSREFELCQTDFIRGDFLEYFDEGGLFSSGPQLAPVDVIIANPPYVLTQVLGARRAQQLATTFGLSGRVDLYQAFLVAMTKQLRPGGILGVITSNRFLTTKGGMATRRFLRNAYDLLEVVDLGDTKLFEAAVLPALVFARKRCDQVESSAHNGTTFIRIYEAPNDANGVKEVATSVFDRLRKPRSGTFRANGLTYHMTAGRLPIPSDDTRPWTMLTDDESKWVAQIDAASRCRLGDVAKVRVGIKTTADKVFIRRDWHLLPSDIRPDDDYLRALLSQEDAGKWRPLGHDRSPKQVLYTHEVVDGRRRTIRFDENSSTWRYFEANRERLEGRKYLVDAGRRWYEIWVPQNPAEWILPKIVFPDISPDARFFLDRQGCIVDGNCYWITTNEPADEELLLLILGVANSNLMARYHDLVFQNKLYSQRRRHLTQYVAQYPLPNRDQAASRKIAKAVSDLVTESISCEIERRLVSKVDRLIAEAFGMDPSLAMDTLD